MDWKTNSHWMIQPGSPEPASDNVVDLCGQVLGDDHPPRVKLTKLIELLQWVTTSCDDNECKELADFMSRQ